MKRFVQSALLALNGIGYAIRTQRHMRIHCMAAVAVIATGLLLSISALEWAVIVLTIAAVISAELVNTAIEKVVDLASPGQHQLAKLAKDVAAGAVLLTAVGAVAIGLLIFGPPLWRLLTG